MRHVGRRATRRSRARRCPNRRRGPAASWIGREPAVRGADGTATDRADDPDDGARVRSTVRMGRYASTAATLTGFNQRMPAGWRQSLPFTHEA